jgi:Tfp pilus assembly protein PilN
MYLLIVLLATLIALHYLKPKRETYENYDETTCLALAKQNEANIESLKTDVATLLALQDKVQNLQTTTDSNSKQLSTLVDQVYQTPS